MSSSSVSGTLCREGVVDSDEFSESVLGKKEAKVADEAEVEHLVDAVAWDDTEWTNLIPPEDITDLCNHIRQKPYPT